VTMLKDSDHTRCCSVLQRVAVCCSVLQCVAVCCSVLQCVAVRVVVRVALLKDGESSWATHGVAVFGIELQCVSVCCNACCSVYCTAGR